MTRARSLLVALAVLAPAAVVARAADPAEQAYLTARDGYVNQFKDLEELDPKADQAALLALEPKIRKVVGAVNVPGFSGTLRSNLQTLQQDGGFGRIDGLTNGKPDNALFVTTEGLFSAWLPTSGRPQTLDTALTDADLYFQSVGGDASFSAVAPLELRKPFGVTTAGAELTLESQDPGAEPPNSVVVYVRGGGRILMSKFMTTPAEIPACADKKAAAPDNDAAVAAYRACYAAEAPKQPFYHPLLKKAQDLADRLAAGAAH